MSSTLKIVVVGGNAAGPAAAAKAKRINPAAEVLLIEKSKFISTGTCEFPYVLSGEIDDPAKVIFFNEKSFEANKGVKVLCGASVEKIDRRRKELLISRNSGYEHLSYDKIILTTGSTAREIPSISTAENFSNLKNADDLISLKDTLSSAEVQNIAIIGAGYIGLETADALKKLGKNVTIFELAELPLPGAEPEIQALVLEKLNQKNIVFIGHSESAQYLRSSDKITAVKFDGRIREFDFVIGALGFKPNVILAENAGLEIGRTGAIKVDSKLKTSDPNIYAAGDCIEVTEFVTRKPMFLPVATFAHQAGHIAGENAAGGNAYFTPRLKNTAVKIFDSVYTTVGITQRQAVDHRFNVRSVSAVANNLVHVFPGSKKVFGKISWDSDSGNLLGASFFGGQEAVGYADLVSSMIRTKQQAKLLCEIDFNYTPPLSPFVNLLSILGRKIKQEI